MPTSLKESGHLSTSILKINIHTWNKLAKSESLNNQFYETVKFISTGFYHWLLTLLCTTCTISRSFVQWTIHTIPCYHRLLIPRKYPICSYHIYLSRIKQKNKLTKQISNSLNEKSKCINITVHPPLATLYFMRVLAVS